MKYKDMVNELEKMGYKKKKSRRSPHERWTNGVHTVFVPRHKEINEFTARGILKEAKKNMER